MAGAEDVCVELLELMDGGGRSDSKEQMVVTVVGDRRGRKKGGWEGRWGYCLHSLFNGREGELKIEIRNQINK